ncbi:Required for respiratory growth protein 9, mitochondrial [Grifola frondosa]|uniref:Required for respiratory growth protein 9, mitochondrial n=1 Tax=Grifola frondosa TaxID=5627 RepID=A0A1C7LUV3_GRIFR|nr:Required for respiratory growth protein 9, mitochondrial [Grifola frondosa]
MLSIARTIKPRPKVIYTFVDLYTTVAGLKPKNWDISAIPKPQSLVEDESSPPPSPKPSPNRKIARSPTPRGVLMHRGTMQKSFPDGWAPPRKLSREAMDSLRALHAMNPKTFTTPVLAEKFRISPEGVRRILKSKWEPTKEKREQMMQKQRQAREEWIQQRRLEEMQGGTKGTSCPSHDARGYYLQVPRGGILLCSTN